MRLFLTLGVLLAVAGGVRAQEDTKTLLDVVLEVNKQTGEFSTLIAAAVELDLAGALAGEDPLTVFAPTDDAFERLGLDADNIGDVPESLLRPIILYHITAGKRLASDLLPKSRNRSWFRATILEMLNGGYAFVFNTRRGPSINLARIVTADVEADNGVAHVIDRVLVPLLPIQRG
jgi:uncharacterized surface protein with fasciclin (FAS1) repeats